MKELKFLSAKAIVNLNDIVGLSRPVSEIIKIDDNIPQILITANFEAESFKVQLNGLRDADVCLRKGLTCEIRKVKKGIFENCYCITEVGAIKGRIHANAYIIHKDGIFALSSEEKISRYDDISAEERELLSSLDEKLDRKYIEKKTAIVLNTCDVFESKNKKSYIRFLSKLPISVVTENRFFDNVSNHFFGMKEAYFNPQIAKEYADLISIKHRTTAFGYAKNFIDNAIAEDNEREIN